MDREIAGRDGIDLLRKKIKNNLIENFADLWLIANFWTHLIR